MLKLFFQECLIVKFVTGKDVTEISSKFKMFILSKLPKKQLRHKDSPLFESVIYLISEDPNLLFQTIKGLG